MPRRPFQTPPSLPVESVSRCLIIPNSREWLGIFNSALLELAQAYNYEQVNETDMTPEETAEACFQIYVTYLQGDCTMDCADILACVPPVGRYQPLQTGTIRVNPVTGQPEWSPDGGTTWTPIPPDGATEIQVPPLTATPGDSDYEKRCLAATRAAMTLNEFWKSTFGAVAAGLHNTLLSINLFLHDVKMALFNAVYSPHQGILEAVGFFDFDFGSYMTAPDLTAEQLQDLICMLLEYSAVDPDGIVIFDHPAVYANLISVMGVNPGTALTLLVGHLQDRGLNRAGNVNVTTEGQCDVCDGWCYEFDFTEADHGFVRWPVSFASATRVNGEGWTNTSTASVIIRRDLAPSVQIKRMEVDYWRNAPAGGSQETDMYIGGAYQNNPGMGFGEHTYAWTGDQLSAFVGAGMEGPAGQQYIRRMRLYGDGVNPFGEDNCGGT